MKPEVPVTKASPLTTSDPVRSRRWPAAKVILACAISTFALCLLVLCNATVPYTEGGSTGLYAVWWPWWQVIRIAGFVGFWLACISVALGFGALLAAIRKDTPKWRGLVTIVLSAMALGVTGLGIWLVHEPPYFLHGLREPPTAQLDALSPEAVVRTYFTSQDLSVEYRLEDAAGRQVWSEPNAVPDLSLLPGVDDLRISPAKGEPPDATRLSFNVAYTSRAPNNIGEPPGAQQVVVNLVRKPGGPWRVAYVGDGM